MKNSLPPKFPNAKQTLQFALHWEQTLIAAQVSLSKLTNLVLQRFEPYSLGAK